MHYIEVGKENSATIDLHYQDHDLENQLFYCMVGH